MLIKILLMICLLGKFIKAASVVDKADQQDGINYKDYCPKSPHCPEGSHSLCLYYNTNRKYGPTCYKTQKNISMTKEYSKYLIDTINKYRGEVAMGKLKGKNNITLPRGYGINELQWDPELATFAQIYANYCPTQEDFCRATKKFPYPTQFLATTSFEYDGNPLSNAEVFEGINITLAQIYKDRYFVDEDMIKNVPDWDAHPRKIGGKKFVNLIYAKPTHIGCGIIIFEMVSRVNLDHGVSLLVICNLSEKPTPGMPLYATEPTKPTPKPPTTRKPPKPPKICPELAHCEVRFMTEPPPPTTPPPPPPRLSKCGCPPGTKDTDTCLCRNSNLRTPVFNARYGEDREDQCESTVLLPIFTEKNETNSITRHDLTEIFMPDAESQSPDVNEVFGLDYRRENNFAVYKSEEREIAHKYVIPRKKKFPNARKRLDSQQDSTWISDQQPKHLYLPKIKRNNKYKIRRSIFASAPKFQLRSSGKNHHSNFKPEVKSVTASQYFSARKQPLFKYLTEKRKREKVILNNTNAKSQGTVNSNEDNLEIEQHSDDNQAIDEITEVPTENENQNEPPPEAIDEKNEASTENKENANENYPPADDEIPTNFHHNNSHSDVITEDESMKDPDDKNNNLERVNKNGNKLIKLLDTVEKEIRNSRIDSSEKEIVHAKLKKIFDTVIGKPKVSAELLPVETSSDDYKSNTPFDFNTGLSEGEFETKTRVEDERKILFPTQSAESHDYQGMRPTYQYREEVNIANCKNLESTPPLNEVKHSSYNLEDREPITGKLYKSVKIFGLDGEKQKTKYDKNGHGFEDKCKGSIANNDRMSNKYIKYDTVTDYDEDLLDEERRKHYQEKIEELDNNAFQQRNNDMDQMTVRQQHMRERMQGAEKIRAKASRFYENYRTRFIQKL